MYMHPILFSFSVLFSTASLLSADKPQNDAIAVFPVNTLQALCERAIESNIATYCNSLPYNSTKSTQLVQCVKNKLIHTQPEEMPTHINQYPLVIQLELLDATHEYTGGNDEERKKFFAQLETTTGGDQILRSILNEIGRLHAEKLEQSIQIDLKTNQRTIYIEKDVTWKIFPYESHRWNKRIETADYCSIASIKEVKLSPTQIMAPPVYINLFYAFQSEVDASKYISLPVKTLKILDWKNFDAVNEWICNEGLDQQSRLVWVIYDSADGINQRLTFSCDSELGNSFGDTIAYIFKLYNHYRFLETAKKYENVFKLPDVLLISSAEIQSPRACDWINREVITRKEKQYLNTATQNQ